MPVNPFKNSLKSIRLHPIGDSSRPSTLQSCLTFLAPLSVTRIRVDDWFYVINFMHEPSHVISISFDFYFVNRGSRWPGYLRF